jgi:hypothetical protein
MSGTRLFISDTRRVSTRPRLRRHGVSEKWIHDFMTKTGAHETFWWGTYKSWPYSSATNKSLRQ